MPERIQRKRECGWRMPPNTLYVGRPGPWGNPYWHVERFHGRDLAIALYANTARGIWNPGIVVHLPDFYVAGIHETHQGWLERIGGHPIERAQSELRGHNHACWCPLCPKHALGKPIGVVCADCRPCHSDVTLEIAHD